MLVQHTNEYRNRNRASDRVADNLYLAIRQGRGVSDGNAADWWQLRADESATTVWPSC